MGWGPPRPSAELPPEAREMLERRMSEGRERMQQAREEIKQRFEQAKEKFQQMEARLKALEAEVERLKAAKYPVGNSPDAGAWLPWRRFCRPGRRC